MTALHKQLVEQLKTVPELTIQFWKNSDRLCVYYQGKEVAHFHGTEEIDIRLTPKIIKQSGFTPPPHSTSHPDRSKNSRWLVQSIEKSEDIETLVDLVQIAAKLRADAK